MTIYSIIPREKIQELALPRGDNTVSVTGEGTATFTYTGSAIKHLPKARDL